MADWNQVAKECDKIETAAMNRIQRNYTNALKRAVASAAAFFKKVEKVYTGEIKPPVYYENQGDAAVVRWRTGYVQEMLRRENVIANIVAELQKAGGNVPDEIRGAMQAVYKQNYEASASALTAEGKEVGLKFNFHQLDTRQLSITMDRNEGVFSKIAYAQFQNPALLTQRLQDEFFQATRLGEDRRQIIKRIQNVTGYEYNRAKRIAQTERTRVQSQARFRAGQDAAAAGVGVYNEWSCAMMETSRETHINLNGQKRMQNEFFELSDGDKLRYPGDPVGRACNIINCYCALIPHVLLPGEYLNGDGTIGRSEPAINNNSSISLQNEPESSIIYSRGIPLNLQMFAEKDLQKQSTSSIRKGIANFEMQIEEHQWKIDNAELVYEDWNEVPDYIKKGRLKHWKKEIDNFKKSIEERKQVLQERGKDDDDE